MRQLSPFDLKQLTILKLQISDAISLIRLIKWFWKKKTAPIFHGRNEEPTGSTKGLS